MSQVTLEGRIDELPIEAQEVLRDIVRELNELRRRVSYGAGSPEGRVIGNRGYVWQRTDGGAGTCVYVFEGTDGNTTGWVAK